MKRKVLALIATVAMLFSLAGCSTEGIQLLGKMKEVGAWEAVNTQGSYTMEMNAGSMNTKMDAEIEAYIVQKPMQAEMTMKIKNIDVSVGSETQKFTLSPVKIYMDGLKVYISSSDFKELAAMSGEEGVAELGKVFDLSKEYIALDMTSLFKEMGITVEDLYKIGTDTYTQLEGIKTEVPVVKDGEKYTISLNDEQIVDVVFNLVKEFLGSEAGKTQVEAVLNEMGSTKSSEDAAILFSQIDNLFKDENKAVVKSVIPGTSAKVNYTFDKDSYNAGVDFNLALTMGDQKMSMKIAEAMTTKKADKKAITMPTSVASYDYMELMQSVVSTSLESFTVPKADTITKDGKIYVPVRRVGEALGLQVGYDQETHTVYFEYQGSKLPVQALIVKGRSYMTVEAVKELGVDITIE